MINIELTDIATGFRKEKSAESAFKQTGKNAFTYKQLFDVAETFFKMGMDRSHKWHRSIFGSLFTVLGYQLGQSSVTIARIALGNVSCAKDHINVRVTREDGKKSLFDNPRTPHLCPFLVMALAAFFTNPTRVAGTSFRLFPRTHQEHEYLTWIQEAFKSIYPGLEHTIGAHSLK
jgi:hypothetical protein